MTPLKSALLLMIFAAFACNESGTKAVAETDFPPGNNKIIKQASEAYLKAWSDNDTSAIQAITIRAMVRNVNGKITSGNHAGLLEAMHFWHTALPDFKVTAREVIAVGNRTYTNWTGTGTNTGMFGDTPPTGKKSTVEGFSILAFDDSGQLIHEEVYYDMLGMVENWGYTVVLPDME